MNIDLAGDFLVMAATLAQIKSKMLLPVYGLEDEEDPRMEIVRPLAEYLKIKNAAEKLAGRNFLGQDIFVRSTDKSEYLAPDGEELIQVGLFELIDAFQRILDRMTPDHRVELSADRISVKDRISQLVRIFEDKTTVTFEELFTGNPRKGDIVVTFLAVLEMVRLNLISINQHVQSGIIRLIYL
jgi:segregation and condensation protein A